MEEVRLVLVTSPAAEAPALARRLVEERLAACVNLLSGMASVYRWEGKVEEAEETLMILKTSAGRIRELRERVVALHPYDVPEFVVVPVESGLESYLAWVLAETGERG
ncbi:MAG TPA: divalent-cation tolerance protein CutA [Longimicrobiales bacterium]|nr:divalent-cation tolerance protein CutA [Longimicrobiales bacterium]